MFQFNNVAVSASMLNQLILSYTIWVEVINSAIYVVNLTISMQSIFGHCLYFITEHMNFNKFCVIYTPITENNSIQLDIT